MAKINFEDVKNLIELQLTSSGGEFFNSKNNIIELLKKWEQDNIEALAPKGLLGGFKKKKTIKCFDELEHKSDENKVAIIKALLASAKNIHGTFGVYTHSLIFIDAGFIFTSDLDIDSNGQLVFDLLYKIEDLTEISEEVIDFDPDTSEPIGYYVTLKKWKSPEISVSAEGLDALRKFASMSLEIMQKKSSAELEERRSNVVSEIKTDDSGKIEIETTDALDQLLRKYQADIIKIDRSYIQNFVKTSQFLKTKRENILKIYRFLKSVDDISSLNESYEILKDEKYKYDLILLHSLTMLSSLVDEDMITFYEAYELFDKFGIFNSQWENETSKKLDGLQEIGNRLGAILVEILHQTQKMEASIVGAINNLTYVTESNFQKLNSSLSNKLTAIDSKLRTANLISAIQVYQTYRLTK